MNYIFGKSFESWLTFLLVSCHSLGSGARFQMTLLISSPKEDPNTQCLGFANLIVFGFNHLLDSVAGVCNDKGVSLVWITLCLCNIPVLRETF